MPAISLERIRKESVDLASQIEYPLVFCHRLNELLESYGTPSYKAGLFVLPPKRIPVYHVTPMVFNQLKLELSNYFCSPDSHHWEILNLLWQEPHMESRILAAYLLGQVIIPPEDPVLKTLTSWVTP